MVNPQDSNGKKPVRIPLPAGEGERELEFQLLKDPEKGFSAIAVKDVVNGHVIAEVVLPDDSMIREAEIAGHNPDTPISPMQTMYFACHTAFTTILTAFQIALQDEQ